MKKFADKVYDKLNERYPDLLSLIIYEIDHEEDGIGEMPDNLKPN